MISGQPTDDRLRVVARPVEWPRARLCVGPLRAYSRRSAAPELVPKPGHYSPGERSDSRTPLVAGEGRRVLALILLIAVLRLVIG